MSSKLGNFLLSFAFLVLVLRVYRIIDEPIIPYLDFIVLVIGIIGILLIIRGRPEPPRY